MSYFLDSLESRLKNLLEGTLDRLLFPGASGSLTNQLVKMIDEKLPTLDLNDSRAPDRIHLAVSPERIDAWQELTPTLNQAAEILEDSWKEQGFYFKHPLEIKLWSDPDQTIDGIGIRTSYQGEVPPNFDTALQEVPHNSSAPALPAGAYLIINGTEQVVLDKPVINIGRRSTCDVVINDPMVSRDHLQLRVQQGKYILFDLSSTGGTTINNRPVTTATLKPGDVIRIGKTILIYNQTLTGQGTDTNLIVPLSGTRP